MALPEGVKKDAKIEMEGGTGSEKVTQQEPAVMPAPVETPPLWTPSPEIPKFTVDPEPVCKPTPIPAAKPAPAPKLTPAPKPAAAPDNAVLTKINQRLEGLEQDLDDLTREIETLKKPFNYGPIFNKLEAVQKDLEKLLTPAPEPEKEEAAPGEMVEELLRKLLEKQENNDRQLVRYLRENANFQVQVRQQMQGDLDELREQQSGALFNPILKEISSMYADYQMVLEDDGMSQKTRKNLQALFGQMEDLLLDYEAEVCVSKVGEIRPKQRCRIISQIPTGDETMHNTIAKSRKPGVMRGRLVLAHEFVDVYVYDPALAPKPEETEPPVVEPPVEEPPVVEPPVTEPPVTEPPVVEPPVTEPPVEEPPVTEPPVVEPPVEEPSVEEPPVAEPPVAEPTPEEIPAEETTAEETTTEATPSEETPSEETTTEVITAEETPNAEDTTKPDVADNHGDGGNGRMWSFFSKSKRK